MKKIIKKAKDEPNIAAGLLTLSLSVLGMSEIKLCAWWHFILAFFILAILFFMFYFSVKKLVNIYIKFFERPDISIDLNDEFRLLKENIHSLNSILKEYNDPSCDSMYKNILKQEMLDLCSISIGKIKLIENRVRENDSLEYFKTQNNQELICQYAKFCNSIKTELNNS